MVKGWDVAEERLVVADEIVQGHLYITGGGNWGMKEDKDCEIIGGKQTKGFEGKCEQFRF